MIDHNIDEQSVLSWTPKVRAWSSAVNNGVTSHLFTLELGVRQGDPLSPYIFIITVETLAIALRQKETIKGVK